MLITIIKITEETRVIHIRIVLQKWYSYIITFSPNYNPRKLRFLKRKGNDKVLKNSVTIGILTERLYFVLFKVTINFKKRGKIATNVEKLKAKTLPKKWFVMDEMKLFNVDFKFLMFSFYLILYYKCYFWNCIISKAL